MTLVLRTRHVVLLAAIVLGLAACGEPSEQARLATARHQIEQRDRAGAVVTLKSLLQSHPDSAAGRRLLGRALLDVGDPAAAETELVRALEMGQSEDEVLPDLAEALLAQGKAATLVNKYGATRLTQLLPAAIFLTHLAEAQSIEGMKSEAGALVGQALQLQPDHVPARLLQARFAAAAGDSGRAMALVDAMLPLAAGHADAWVFKADLLQSQGAQPPALLEAYRQALAAQPDSVAAHTGLITVTLRQGDLAAAQELFKAMAKALPRHRQTLVFDAMLSQQRGDHAHAREVLQQALKQWPDDPTVLLLAGQAELRAGAAPQAEALLAKAVRLSPQAAEPRRLLADLLLQSGQPDRVLDVLKPLTGTAKPDVDALVLAGRASMQKGDGAAAQAAFQRAAQLRPNDPRIGLARTMARLGQGRDDAVLAELRTLAAAADQTGTEAAMAIVNAHLARRDLGAALAALDSLAARQPQLPWPDDLRGRIALQRQDATGARGHFERALGKDADYFPSIAMLVSLDLADKQPDTATARLDALLKRRPTHLEALLAKAEVRLRAGAPRTEVRSLLDAAVGAHPSEPMARRALIDFLLAGGEVPLALSTAQAASTAFPDHVELLERLAGAQLAAGDTLQAEAAFKRIGVLQPGAAFPHLRLAEIALMRQQDAEARASIRRARELEPANVDALRADFAMALRDKRPADAMALARNIQAQRPTSVLGLLLQGDVEASRLRWPAAEQIYRQALAKAPGSSEAAQRLHQALVDGGKRDEAEQFVRTWRAAHPTDAVLPHHLASAALARRDWANAEALYSDLVQRFPDDVLSLNNLAYARAHLKKPGAVALAEKAVALAPGRAALLDTLAFCHAAEGQHDKAVEAQKKAVELAGQQPELRLRLARLALDAGDKDRARSELTHLAGLRTGFADQAEVARLLQEAGPSTGAEVSPVEAAPRVAMTMAMPNAPRPSGTAATGTPTTSLALGAALGLGVLAVLGVPAILVLAALRPPLAQLQRSMAIDAPPQRVFDLVHDLHRWEDWSALEPFGSALARRHSGAPAGLGARCSWRDARGVERGWMEVVAAVAPGKVAAEVVFTQGAEHRLLHEITLTPNGTGGTLVEWTMREALTFGQRLADLTRGRGRRFGRLLDTSLARLNSVAARQAAPLPATPLATA